MGIMGILFNPNGRIQANQFWQGVIVLVGFMIVLNLLSIVLPQSVQTLLSYTIFLLPYPYYCVYAKRLHDSGKNGAWFLLLFSLFIVGMIYAIMTLPGMSEIFEAVRADPELQNDQEAVNALMSEAIVNVRTLVQLVGFYFGINLLFGFIVARLFSDPYTNKYGPPVGGEAEGTSDDNDIFS